VPKLQHIESRPAHMLRFANFLPAEVFMNRPLVDADNNPLQIELVNIESGEICTGALSSLKVEIFVVRGDFPSNYRKLKTCKALSPRNKATIPLLVQASTTKTARKGLSCKKKFTVKLHNGRAVVRGKITDNSSWVRSKMFKLVARAVKGSYQEKAIKVALSEAFAVKESKLEGIYSAICPEIL
jgi:Calmodulin binding protein-like